MNAQPVIPNKANIPAGRTRRKEIRSEFFPTVNCRVPLRFKRLLKRTATRNPPLQMCKRLVQSGSHLSSAIAEMCHQYTGLLRMTGMMRVRVLNLAVRMSARLPY